MSRSNVIRDARRLAAGWKWRASYMIGTSIPAEYDDDLVDTIKFVRRHTLSSAQRVAALCDSVEYISRHGIEGDFAECGVWKGGSMMATALTLKRLGDTDRDLYLYDTYSGMAEPTEEDTPSPYDGYSPYKRWKRNKDKSGVDDGGSGWAAISLESVREAMLSTGYPAERIHLVKGLVEDTIPAHSPDNLALLRLDTDWYASTKHELEQLYPRLAEGGVLIVDDYGHYEGARKAVDEYFEGTGQRVLLNRIDYTGRIAIKQGAAVPVQ
jgi:O-methyltransferase